MYLLACWLLGWLVGWSVSRLFRRGRSVSPSVIPSWSVGQSEHTSVGPSVDRVEISFQEL